MGKSTKRRRLPSGSIEESFDDSPYYQAPLGYNPKLTINRYSKLTIRKQVGFLGQLSPAMVMAANIKRVSTLYSNFRSSGRDDLQMRSPSGAKYSKFRKEYTPIASFNYGVAAASSGIPLEVAKGAAGLYNYKKSRNLPKIDASGIYGNNPKNVPNINAGYKYGIAHLHDDDALPPAPPPTPFPPSNPPSIPRKIN